MDACFSVIANTGGVKVNTESWNNLKLIEIGSVQDGDWILKEDYANSGVRLIQIGDIGIGKFLGKSRRYITPERAKELGCNLVDPMSDILISRMPDPIGRACLAPNLSTPYIVAVDIAIFKPNFSVSRDYLIQILNFHKTLEVVDSLASGGTRRRISRKNLENISIPIPSAHEQHKIAGILSSVDVAIEQTDAIIAQTERVKIGLMQELFTKGIGHDDFNNTEFGQLPAAWKIAPISSYLNRIIDYRGKTPKKTENGVPLITAKNVREGYLVKEPMEFIDPNNFDDWMTRGIPAVGDVMFTTEAPIGNVALIPPGKIALAQRIIVLSPNEEKLNNNFLLYMLLSPANKERIQERGTGSTVKGIKQSEFKKIKFAFPPLSEQQVIASIISKMDERLVAEIKYQDHLGLLKKGLMQDLLTGRVRVKVDGHA